MKALPIESSGHTAAVGSRLRNHRRRSHMTIDQLASAAGLTKGFVSRVERDITSPSVDSLVRMCQVLRIDVGALFAGPADVELVRLEDAPHIDLGGEGIEEQLVTPSAQRQVQVIRARVAAGGRGEDAMYSMDCETEVLHLISGRFRLHVPDSTFDLAAGDTVTFPGSEPHTWENPGTEDAVLLWILGS
ncbi:cupin domain-containing protein [Kocuria salina]|uniref:helix-turn-helix domain-containing protein n=1 Tax=Kocuria salina TaxID=1929416 RepID=UPI0015949D9D|nr:cupin domain-containing protein [Kocuria salina]